MQKILSVFKRFDPVVRFLFLALAAGGVIQDYTLNPFNGRILLICIAVLIIFDVGHRKIPFIQHHRKVFNIFSMALCMLIFVLSNSTAIQIYYFFLLDDIFNTQKGTMLKAMVVVHFSGFLAVWCSSQIVRGHKNIEEYIQSFVVLIVSYALILFIFSVIHYFKREQERLKILNADLIEYSFQEREYSIAKERSDISQELHDSIGHSLMAVLMNVRYLKAIQNKNETEREKQLDEIEELLKECVSNLRNSVYSLKELDENICLKDEIDRVIQKFNDLELLNIRLNYDDQVESAPNYVKIILFKTIREGITNSIRHGNANLIQISISLMDKQIEMTIKDNGSGCADIHKSYGLNGIIDRVKKAGGEVWFTSKKNNGFIIKTLLPGGNEN